MSKNCYKLRVLVIKKDKAKTFYLKNNMNDKCRYIHCHGCSL